MNDMTDVITYTCKSCQKSFGPIGMHGYMPGEGNGELPVVCKKCKNIFVGRIENKRITNSNCSNCKALLVLFDGKCPSCGSSNMVFTDMRMKGFEQKAPAVKF